MGRAARCPARFGLERGSQGVHGAMAEEDEEKTKARDLCVGGFLVAEGYPWEVLSRRDSLPGKIGSKKVAVEARSLRGAKKSFLFRAADSLEIPAPQVTEYQALEVDVRLKVVTVLTTDLQPKELELPNLWEDETQHPMRAELLARLEKGDEVIVKVVSVCGVAKVIGVRSAEPGKSVDPTAGTEPRSGED
ncbi:unnamed protein product [Effrenium voratum]|nr:unnamed protein product [Effrenium voratum]